MTRIATLTSVAVALLLLSGCSGGKVGKNWDKIKVDSTTEKEAEELLGGAKESTSIEIPKIELPGMPSFGGKITAKYWEEGDKGYVIYFQDDKAKQKFEGKKDEMKGKMKGGK